MKGTVEQLKQALVPLGQYKLTGSQIRFNCPNCENVLGYDTDKFNLEVSLSRNAFKCWACGQHGNIPMLIKKYGYHEFINLFKKKDVEKGLLEEEKEEEENKIFELPKHLMNVLNVKEAADYLINERGVSKQKIKDRNVKYCYAGDYKDCIIFPSYDETGKLNAFVSHNLKTKKYKKKKAKDFRCFYESFIDKRSLIIKTEGIYDALSVPNATPMLGIGIEDSMLDFLSGTRVLLIVDNDVNEKIIEGLVEQLETVCEETMHHKLNIEYQDLNHYHTESGEELIKELGIYYI